MRLELLHGNCQEKLKELPDNSVDCVITDPPYGISFMGKNWDKALPTIDVWKECLRVLKDIEVYKCNLTGIDVEKSQRKTGVCKDT